ncbi:MAG: hypothetical protein RIQ54_530 [Candidatus Parcubacteria bacterium]|jgi:hypothetical protein
MAFRKINEGESEGIDLPGTGDLHQEVDDEFSSDDLATPLEDSPEDRFADMEDGGASDF